ncbi:carboxymuconolactone decarboxylase family protein [Robbsia andropogonis]|uniref:carboxymuconolactone decarboxylase family protein n=1 Tax=Robbsia andropogonis TaxID=28092 RepID=UPI0004B849F1|nr:carboxymuconolactone decarboxylase family protein [Robbsia andropogonis]MCP1120888.1 carboxymuconolactone decarboxylase family protein [Robbsia andropogonis]MCP1130650.1 carboxymuconolactone decarboxylase family protein [Robbsia andropogonis]
MIDRSTWSERYKKGLAAIKALEPDNGDLVLNKLREVSPGYHDINVEMYGDFFGDDRLSIKTRTLITLTTLAAINAYPGLIEFHAKAALEVGWQPDEIFAALEQNSLFAGFPYAISSIYTVRELFIKLGVIDARPRSE